MRGVARVRQGGDAVVLRGVHGHPQVDLVEIEALSLLELQGLADTIVDLDRETDWRTGVRRRGGRRCLVSFHPCDARPANHGDDGSHGDAPRALAPDCRSVYAFWPHSASGSVLRNTHWIGRVAARHELIPVQKAIAVPINTEPLA